MAPFGVVEGEIGPERSGAPVRAAIRATIGPLAEQRADEALGLAVRLWPIGPGEALADAERERLFREGEGPVADVHPS